MSRRKLIAGTPAEGVAGPPPQIRRLEDRQHHPPITAAEPSM
jgi:hypothetical protein